MRIRWDARETPLVPCGAWASGQAARRLAHRLLAFDDQHLGKLSGLARTPMNISEDNVSEDSLSERHALLIVIGEEQALPWVDGVRYLGRDELAPSLLLPTNLKPSVPLPVFERALLDRASRSRADLPLLVIPEPPSICWAGRARPIVRETLIARFLSSGQRND
ncbi:MAG TPA: hypothetical protein VEZ90_15685 [Blastocatellia bacterium]|nr:hypothetical protein [Blastocatellia bacterium]